MSKIIVVGSSNIDMVVKTDHFPHPGETVLGGEFFRNPGGKGANQAVTVARLGGNTIFVSKVGNDDFGKELCKLYASENIDTKFIIFDNEISTGVALISVDRNGENSIVVASGANMSLSIEDIKLLEDEIEETDIILVQLEIPITVVEHICKLAKAKKCRVVLNPAPAQILPDSIMNNLFLITPNVKEAQALSGIAVTGWETAKEAALAIAKKNVNNIIITLGELGALVYENGEFAEIPTQKVQAIDTTAAGDVFNGALCVALSQGRNLKQAAEFASRASAIAVGRMGALTSIPYARELTKETVPQ